MNSILSPSPSASSNKSPFLFSSFIPSTTLHHRPTSITSLAKRFNYRVSGIRCSSDPEQTASTPSQQVFGGKRELTGVQSLVDSLSPPARIVSSVVIVAAAVGAGYGLGSKLGASRNAAIGGAIALGVAGGAAAYAMNSCVPEVAAANLHNFVAESDDPTAVKEEDIEAIATKYGVSKQDEAFNLELCELYCRFVESILPSANEDLKGTEVETILKFKNALGIDDPEAANMHIEIGRRISRQRLETGDREADAEQRRAFQKLVYVSTLVFGDASSFLLPWKRVFKVSDSQVEVAIRDNAQRLYAHKLKLIGRDLDVNQLIDLRDSQVSYKLSDELAKDMFRDHTRKIVEEYISKALELLKSRARAIRGIKPVVEEIDRILSFNSMLLSLKDNPEANRLARGIGSVSLVGGEYDSDRRIDDLKLLYRAYITDSLSSGRMEENKIASLNQLRNIFGLGKREAEAVTMDVTSKVYLKQLTESISGGHLEAADSKAAFLQNLCEQLRFDPQKASEIHEEMYKQKLQQCLSDGELSDEDVKALQRLRVMLCIPQNVVEATHADACGGLFEKVVIDAVASGVDGYDADVKASVRKAAHGLRLTREAAMSIAGKAVRKIFINYIKQARGAGSRTESARTLKKLVAYNALVVTELVADIKGESSDAAKEEPAKDVQKIGEEDEEWESLQTLRKTRPDKELEAKMGKPGQTEITLKDDLPERDRKDLYETYLMYCLTGEVTRIPFGAQITTKKDNSEFLYLNQLGGILGLTREEIVDVHRRLAEQAFRQQAEVILADGQLTASKMEQLNELQKKVGLPSEYAEKLKRSITTSKLTAALETAIARGKMDIKQIREFKAANVDLGIISESLRESLFKKTVEGIFSSGTGEFDEEEVYNTFPADLNINAEKAKGVVHELAKTRLSNSLIQAVALLRQRNRTGVVSSLNDLLACDKAVPGDPLSWDSNPDELGDLFAIYVQTQPTPEKSVRLQYLLGISDSAAAELRQMGDRVMFG